MPEVSVKIRAVFTIPVAFSLAGGKDRNMIKKYEDACRKAGLSEERTREISRVLEVERSRFRREKEGFARKGYSFTSLYCKGTNMDDTERCIEDNSMSLEDAVIKEMELEQLRIELGHLTKEDRDLLFAYFDPETNFSQYVRSIGEDRFKMLRKKDQIVKMLRESLKEWIVED